MPDLDYIIANVHLRPHHSAETLKNFTVLKKLCISAIFYCSKVCLSLLNIVNAVFLKLFETINYLGL